MVAKTENRWVDEVGFAKYEEIMRWSPGHTTVRNMVVEELGMLRDRFDCIEDIGAGTGDSTRPIASRFINCPIIMVDSDESALMKAKSLFIAGVRDNPEGFGDLSRLSYVDADVFEYLNTGSRLPGVPAITCSWFAHNFTSDERSRLFKAAATRLRNYGGSVFVLMDKIVSSEPVIASEQWTDAIKLFDRYLPEPLRTAMLRHEKVDWRRRMILSETISQLGDSGYNVYFSPRVGREIVLVCTLKD